MRSQTAITRGAIFASRPGRRQAQRVLPFVAVPPGAVIVVGSGAEAIAAWRTAAARQDDELRRRYFSVMHRRGRPKAKVALARKLLVRLYSMLRDQIDDAEFRRRGRTLRSQPLPVAAR